MFQNDKIYLLDGAIGQELKERGVPEVGLLWTAMALKEHPDIVRQLHADYITAGADIITTNNYSVTHDRFETHEILAEMPDFLNLACDLAQEAIAQNPQIDGNGNAKKILLAGALPPLRASYRPDLTFPFDQSVAQYQQICDQMKDKVDLFIIETMSVIDEARAALTAIQSTGKPVLLSWALLDDAPVRIRGGETLRDAYQAVAHLPFDALMINCSRPEIIGQALAEIADANILPNNIVLGAYGNGFEQIPEGWRGTAGTDILGNRHFSTDEYLSHVKAWLETGAKIVGGCCHISPKHIAAIREFLNR